MFDLAKIKKTISFFFVALFISHYVSTNFFIHTHTFTWGTVTHSHPYSSDAHSHNAKSLQLIDSFTKNLFIGSITILYSAFLSVFDEYFFFLHRTHALTLVSCNSLRGPPALT